MQVPVAMFPFDIGSMPSRIAIPSASTMSDPIFVSNAADEINKRESEINVAGLDTKKKISAGSSFSSQSGVFEKIPTTKYWQNIGQSLH